MAEEMGFHEAMERAGGYGSLGRARHNKNKWKLSLLTRDGWVDYPVHFNTKREAQSVFWRLSSTYRDRAWQSREELLKVAEEIQASTSVPQDKMWRDVLDAMKNADR